MYNLTTKSYNGTVLSDIDPERKGRYLVRIPGLQPLLSESRGVWIKNHIHKYRDNTSSQYGRYGQYFPIMPEARVLVKFYSNDTNSGYIDSIIDDDIPNDDISGTSLPADSKLEPGDNREGTFKIPLPFNAEYDRDEMFQIIRTPKHQNLFMITEDTTGDPLPKNSIHLYHDKHRTKMVMNEYGYNLMTKQNKIQLIDQSHFKDILMNEHIMINQDKHDIVNNEKRDYIKNNYYTISDKSIYIQSNDNAIHLLSPGNLGTINLAASQNIALTTTEKSSIINILSSKNIGLYSFADDSNITLGSIGNINLVSQKKITIASTEEIEFTAPKITLYSNKITFKKLTFIQETFSQSLKRAKDIIKKFMGEIDSSKIYKSESNQKYNSNLQDRPTSSTESKSENPKLESLTVENIMKFIRKCVIPPKLDKKDPPTITDVRALKSIRVEPLKPSTIKFEK